MSNYQTIKAKRLAGNPEDPVTVEDLKTALSFEIANYREGSVRFALADGEYRAAIKLSPLPTDDAAKELSAARDLVAGAHVHISKLVYWLHKLEAGHPIVKNSLVFQPMAAQPAPIEGEDASDLDDEDSYEDEE